MRSPSNAYTALYPGGTPSASTGAVITDRGVSNYQIYVENASGANVYRIECYAQDGQLIAVGDVSMGLTGLMSIPTFLGNGNPGAGDVHDQLLTWCETVGLNYTGEEVLKVISCIKCTAAHVDATVTPSRRVFVVPVGGDSLNLSYPMTVSVNGDPTANKAGCYLLGVGTVISATPNLGHAISESTSVGTVNASGTAQAFVSLATPCRILITATASSASAGTLGITVYPTDGATAFDAVAMESALVTTSSTTAKKTWIDLPQGTWKLLFAATTVNYTVSYSVCEA